MKREEKTTTFLSAGRKYGLEIVKKLCTHVQVLGVVAMGKDERQGCNVSYCLAATFIESNIWEKLDPDRRQFLISAIAGVCAVISQVKTWVNYDWMDDCSGSLNRSRILKFEE